MPHGDKTGPDGFGPASGRKMGYCAGNTKPGYTSSPVRGRSNRISSNRRGFRNRFFATGLLGWMRTDELYSGNKEKEIESLRKQAEYLYNSVQNINKRISELENKDKD